MSSIKQTANATSAPASRPRLPNFCNLGVTLRTLVLVNVLAAAGSVVRSSTLTDFAQHFATLSVIVQPALILSLIGLCGVRRWLGEPSPGRDLAVFIAVETIVASLAYWLLSLAPFGPASVTAVQFAVLFAFICLVVIVYFDMRSRALSPSLTEARLQALQARIRPHFLFNSLNAALGLIRSEPARAERVLENMAELFRGLINENRQLVRLDEEVNLCLNYLEIEQIRLGERLKVTWKIGAMPADALVPPLILQPLVENAVYHGIEPLEAQGEIVIEIAERGRELLITLTNPLPAAAASPHAMHGNHIALANITERLQLHYDAEASLRTETADGRYRVTIVLPTLVNAP